MPKLKDTLFVRHKLINEGFSLEEFVGPNTDFGLDHGDLIIYKDSVQVAAFAKGSWLSVIRKITLGGENGQAY